MITVLMNDKRIVIEENFSLTAALNAAGYKKLDVAVAVNRNFIPRSQYSSIILNEGDCVEIVSPMQGG